MLRVKTVVEKIMGSKNSYSNNSAKLRPFTIFLILLSLTLLFVVFSFRPKPTIDNNFSSTTTSRQLHKKINAVINQQRLPEWFQFIAEEFTKIRTIKNNNKQQQSSKVIKIGLVNLESSATRGLRGLAADNKTEIISVRFDHLAEEDLKWEEFFPEWIDEESKWGPPKCPEVPLPSRLEAAYDDLDVVVAEIPCPKYKETTTTTTTTMTRMKEGVRDVFGLQVNLAAGNVALRSGWMKGETHRTVYVVFVGKCGPMPEIFRCDDLVRKRAGDYWVYKPEITRLKQKMLMPFGSCQLAPAYAQTGKEAWRSQLKKINTTTATITTIYRRPKYAYATILHSSEAYVCGAIALAQSIRRTNSTKPLVLLADDSIGPKSLRGLRAAGWHIVPTHRIRSPFAQKGSYNEWNYSKLRLWQLTYFDKLIFIDADLLVLRNLDFLFVYPQISAAPNDKSFFNSGLMVVEPSNCLFEVLMRKSFELASYNGGDQGFLNEFFTWWHRLPTRTNFLKIFQSPTANDNENDEYGNDDHVVPEVTDTIHYLGLKPWMCYKDYDCNWDMADHRVFASDEAHRRWWEVYDAMPKKLQSYCGLTKKMDTRIRKWRGIAKKTGLPDGHWKIRVKDPRQHRYVE